MAISFVDCTMYPASAASNTVTVPLNDGTPAAGQHCIIAVEYRGGSGNTVVTPPSGWTIVTTASNDSTVVGLVAYEKILTSGDISGSAAVVFSSSANLLCGTRYLSSAVDSADAVVAAAATNTGGTSSTTATAPSVDPGGVTGCQLVVIYAINGTNSGTIPAPSGMTARGQASTTAASGNVTGAVFDEALAAGTATGTRTTTHSATAQRNVGLSVLLRPAAVGGGTTITHTTPHITNDNEVSSLITAGGNEPTFIAGDYIRVTAVIRNNPGRTFSGNPTVPSGLGAWTKTHDTVDGDAQLRMATWVAKATGSGTAALTVTMSGQVNTGLLIVQRVRGLHGTNGLAVPTAGTPQTSASSPVGDSTTIPLTNTIATTGSRYYVMIGSRHRTLTPSSAYTALHTNSLSEGGINSGEWTSASSLFADTINANQVIGSPGSFTTAADWTAHALVATPLTAPAPGGGGGGSTGTPQTITGTYIAKPSAWADAVTHFKAYGANPWVGFGRWRNVETGGNVGAKWEYQRFLATEIYRYTGSGDRNDKNNYQPNWSIVDSFINKCAARGAFAMIGLRFMGMGSDVTLHPNDYKTTLEGTSAYSGLPEWVWRRGLGVEVRRVKSGLSGSDAGHTFATWYHDHGHAEVLAFKRQYARAWVARYGNNPWVKLIEWAPGGRSGEWHFESGAPQPSETVWKQLIDMGFQELGATWQLKFMMGGADKYKAYVHSQYGNGANTPSAAFRGWDIHSYGAVDIPEDDFTWLTTNNAWQGRDIHLEFIGSSWDADSSTDRNAAADQLGDSHGATIGQGNVNQANSFDSWTTTGKNFWGQLLLDAGYRYWLPQVKLPTTISRSDPFTIETSIRNVNVSSVVDAVEFVHQWRSGITGAWTSVEHEVVSALDLRDIGPTGDVSTVHTDQVIIPPSLPFGSYMYGVLPRFVDTDYGSMKMPMTVSGTAQQADGFIPISSVTISGEVAGQTPAAPSSVSITGTSPNLTVSWTDNATNESNYYVGVNPDPNDPDDFDQFLELPMNTASTPITITVAFGETITADVWAENPFGESTRVRATYTNVTPPSAITTVTATAVTNGIEVAWTAFPVDVLIEKSVNGGTDYVPWQQLSATDAPLGRIIDTDAVPSTSGAITYRYRVANDDGSPSYIQSNTVVVPQATPPPEEPPTEAPPETLRLEWLRNGHVINLTDNFELVDGIKCTLLQYAGLGSLQSDLLIDRAPFQQSVTGRGFRRQPRIVDLIVEIYADVGVEGKYLHLANRRLTRLFQTGVLPGTLRCTTPLGDVRLLDAHFRQGLDWPSEDSIGGLAQRSGIQLQANEPTFYAADDTVVFFHISVVPNGGTIPAAIPRGVGSSVLDQAITVPYDGDVSVSPIIQIQGPVTGVTITNETTGAVLAFEDTVAIPEDTLYTIDTREGFLYVSASGDAPGVYRTSELTATSNLAGFVIASEIDGAFMGVNTIRVTGTLATTETEVTIRYRPRYLSV